MCQISLKHIVSQSAGQCGGIFVVDVKQSGKGQRSYQQKNNQEKQALSAFSFHKHTSLEKGKERI